MLGLINNFHSLNFIQSLELGIVSFLATLLLGIIIGTFGDLSKKKTNLKKNSVYTVYGKNKTIVNSGSNTKNYSTYSKTKADVYKEKAKQAAQMYKNTAENRGKTYQNNAVKNSASQFNPKSNVTQPIKNSENFKKIDNYDVQKQNFANRTDINNLNTANEIDRTRDFMVDKINLDYYEGLNNNKNVLNSNNNYNNNRMN